MKNPKANGAKSRLETATVIDCNPEKNYGFATTDIGEVVCFPIFRTHLVVADKESPAFAEQITTAPPKIGSEIVFIRGKRRVGDNYDPADPWARKEYWDLVSRHMATAAEKVVTRTAVSEAIEIKPMLPEPTGEVCIKHGTRHLLGDDCPKCRSEYKLLEQAPEDKYPKVQWQGDNLEELRRLYPLPLPPAESTTVRYWFERRISLARGWEPCEDPRDFKAPAPEAVAPANQQEGFALCPRHGPHWYEDPCEGCINDAEVDVDPEPAQVTENARSSALAPEPTDEAADTDAKKKQKKASNKRRGERRHKEYARNS